MSLDFLKLRAEAELEARRRRAIRTSRDAIERWRADPVLYAGDRFGIACWKRQAELLRACAQNPLVAVRAGQKVSKTLSEAVLAFWFAECFPGALAIFTAPGHRQVDEIAWAEVRRLWRRAAERGTPIDGHCSDTPGGGFDLANGSRGLGFATAATRPDKMSGFSGKKLLYIVDEATGVAQPIFDAIHGNRAGGARMLMFSNPLNVTGEFFDAFHGNAELWHKIHISSLESPNVVERREVIEGLATLEWLRERRIAWNGPPEGSPLYTPAGEPIGGPLWCARVLGEFPTSSSDAIMGLALVTAATARWRTILGAARGRLEFGVDVARYGSDRTVIFPRRGKALLDPIILTQKDTVEVAEEVERLAQAELDAGGQTPIARIDDSGVGGGVTDILKRSTKVHAVPINASERADDEDGYHNLRAQLWFGLRTWLEEGGALPPGARGLDAELLEPKYKFDVRGRRQVESKDEIKKRLGGRSTDLADAACLAAYTRGAIVQQEAPEIQSRGAFDSRELPGHF